MKTIVGYIFTENLIHQLSKAGFNFIKIDKTIKNGYYEYLLVFKSASADIQALEFREVVDELLYFSRQDKKDFAPFINDHLELNLDSIASIKDYYEHPNSLCRVNGILTESMPPCDLKLFLKIRKPHPLWAIEIECQDFNKFIELAKPDLFFDWQHKKSALIHLGSSCFDILVN